jgi:hypothetical protein
VSSRETDTATAIAGIIGIVLIVAGAIMYGLDHTVTKIGIACIAGLAGFSIRGLIRWQ